jgi:transposase InsO family protein
MRQVDRYGRTPRRWKTTTVADPAAAARPDLIGRDFGIDPDQPTALDTRWCGDITYIHTWQGWLYLATVIDLASRRVVGWATVDHQRTDLIADALTDAVNRRRPAPGVVFHSDRGCQTRLNGWTQHRLVGLRLAGRRVPRLVSSTSVSCGVGR